MAWLDLVMLLSKRRSGVDSNKKQVMENWVLAAAIIGTVMFFVGVVLGLVI
jgi:hypothetical protein